MADKKFGVLKEGGMTGVRQEYEAGVGHRFIQLYRVDDGQEEIILSCEDERRVGDGFGPVETGGVGSRPSQDGGELGTETFLGQRLITAFFFGLDAGEGSFT